MDTTPISETPISETLEKTLRKFQSLNRQKHKLECQLKCVKIEIRQLIDYHIHSPHTADLKKAIKTFKKKNQKLRKNLVRDFTNVHLDTQSQKGNNSPKKTPKRRNKNGETNI